MVNKDLNDLWAEWITEMSLNRPGTREGGHFEGTVSSNHCRRHLKNAKDAKMLKNTKYIFYIYM